MAQRIAVLHGPQHKIVGSFDLAEAEWIQENGGGGIPIKFAFQTDEVEWNEPIVVRGQFMLLTRSYFHSRGVVNHFAELVDRETVAAWLMNNRALPKPAFLTEFGLTDFTLGNVREHQPGLVRATEILEQPIGRDGVKEKFDELIPALRSRVPTQEATCAGTKSSTTTPTNAKSSRTNRDWDALACGLLCTHLEELDKLSDLYPILQEAGYPHGMTAMYGLKALRKAAEAAELAPKSGKVGRIRRGSKSTDGQIEATDDTPDGED